MKGLKMVARKSCSCGDSHLQMDILASTVVVDFGGRQADLTEELPLPEGQYINEFQEDNPTQPELDTLSMGYL